MNGQLTPLVVYGASNAVCLRVVHQINRVEPTWTVVGLLDDDPAKQGTERWGFPVVGGSERLAEFAAQPDLQVFNNVRGHWTRTERVAGLLDDAGSRIASLMHPMFDLTWIEAGRGLFVCSGAEGSSDMVIGDHVTIFGNCILGHDVTIGDYTVVAQLSSVGSDCSIGDRCFLGAGCIILPGVTIGSGAVVGAGSVVTKDVAPGAKVMGVPGRPVVRSGEADR